MSNTSGVQLASGFRHAVIFELDANGYPAATGTSPYEGFTVVGPKAYTLTVPDARKIVHVGNDRVLALDFLPATEAMSAELRAAADDIPLNAMLTNVKEFQIGEAQVMPLGTDQQGSEPNIAMLFFQQSLAAGSKLRNYRFHILPKCRAIPMAPGMDDNAAEMRYSIAPSPSSTHLWGSALTVGSEGALEAGILDGQAEGRPAICAFKGDGSTTVFLLPADKPAKSTAKMEVWDNGVLVTGSVTLATTQITFAPFPATGHKIVVYWEY